MPRVYLEDVGGRLERFFRTAPKEVREQLAQAVRVTGFAVGQRMKAKAPVGPDAPHIKDDIEVKARGLTARIGFLTAKQAAPGSDATQPEVALYNEYRPNKQPFMRPAADDEAGEFKQRITKALKAAERSLSGGGGLT